MTTKTTQSAANLLIKLRAEGRKVKLDRDQRGFKVYGPPLPEPDDDLVMRYRDEIIAILIKEKISKKVKWKDSTHDTFAART